MSASGALRPHAGSSLSRVPNGYNISCLSPNGQCHACQLAGLVPLREAEQMGSETPLPIMQLSQREKKERKKKKGKKRKEKEKEGKETKRKVWWKHMLKRETGWGAAAATCVRVGVDDDDSLIACDPLGSWRYYIQSSPSWCCGCACRSVRLLGGDRGCRST